MSNYLLLTKTSNRGFVNSLRAINCVDLYDDGTVYVKNKVVNNLVDISKWEILDVGTLLIDLSIQVSMLWESGQTFLPIDINDIRKVNKTYCIINSSKVVTYNQNTGTCDLVTPINISKHIGPDVKQCDRLPCLNYCFKESVLYCIGSISKLLLSDQYKKQTSIRLAIDNLMSPEPNARLPVVF